MPGAEGALHGHGSSTPLPPPAAAMADYSPAPPDLDELLFSAAAAAAAVTTDQPLDHDPVNIHESTTQELIESNERVVDVHTSSPPRRGHPSCCFIEQVSLTPDVSDLQLFVRFPDGTTTTVTTHSLCTVAELKDAIEDLYGIPVHFMRMLHGSRPLSDDVTIQAAGLVNYSLVLLLFRLRGGMQAPAIPPFKRYRDDADAAPTHMAVDSEVGPMPPDPWASYARAGSARDPQATPPDVAQMPGQPPARPRRWRRCDRDL